MPALVMSKPKASKAAAASEKAALRERLPGLLSDANSNAEAAQAALRACVALKKKPPISLLTEENINALSPIEILKLTPVFLDAKRLVDLKGPLNTLRASGRRLPQPPSRKTLTQISKGLVTEVNKILKNQNTAVRFTDSTVAAFNANLLWLLPELFQQKKQSKTDLPLAVNLLFALDRIWRHSIQPKTAAAVVEFFGSLRGSIPVSVYWDLMDDPRLNQLARDAQSALHSEASAALREGRLRDLQRIFRLIKDSEERRALIRQLDEICVSQPSQVASEVADWLARETGADTSRPKKLIAADQSQSSELNYVVVSLLDAWNAAGDGERSLRSLESVERLARQLYRVEFFGDKGEVVQYDELKHEIPNESSPPTSVEILRPGVQHSEGGRTRFLVRAVAKPLS
jgi:hypothetical protein